MLTMAKIESMNFFQKKFLVSYIDRVEWQQGIKAQVYWQICSTSQGVYFCAPLCLWCLLRYFSEYFLNIKRKFVSQGNSFDSLILLPFLIMLEVFNLNFLICWFILSKTLKFLYTKFLESAANITAKFRLHTRINFFIHLLTAFFISLYLIHYWKWWHWA